MVELAAPLREAQSKTSETLFKNGPPQHTIDWSRLFKWRSDRARDAREHAGADASSSCSVLQQSHWLRLEMRQQDRIASEPSVPSSNPSLRMTISRAADALDPAS